MCTRTKNLKLNEIKELAELQDADEKLAVLKCRVAKCQRTYQCQFGCKTTYYTVGERILKSDTRHFCQAV
jgi:hypothetical protein